MSDTNDLTEQLPTVPHTDGCAPPVDDDNDMTPSMHKVSVQEVASELAAIKLTCVNNRNSDGSTVCNFVGVSFAHQPAAPEDHQSSGTAGSSINGLLEVIERELDQNFSGA